MRSDGWIVVPCGPVDSWVYRKFFARRPGFEETQRVPLHEWPDGAEQEKFCRKQGMSDAQICDLIQDAVRAVRDWQGELGKGKAGRHE